MVTYYGYWQFSYRLLLIKQTVLRLFSRRESEGREERGTLKRISWESTDALSNFISVSS